jgi:hypothetical protein
MSDLVKLSDVLGPMREMATIKPPGKTLDDWERFLRQAAEVALDSPLGFALMKRKRWLNHARAANMTYEAAELAWSGARAPETEADLLEAYAREQGLL